MKSTSLILSLMVLLCAPLSLASADDDTKVRAKNRDQATQHANSAIRVSEMMGMNIHNEAGESVGEIKDIVLDANTGKVRYAAVTYGGLLGVGNKMFAVPYEAFRCKTDSDDPSERVLILNVTPERLKGATGFNEDNWPDFANKQWARDLNKLYGVERRTDNRERDNK